MRTITMNNELWVEVMSDLAVILAEDYGDGLDVVVDENGDEYYTEESQERSLWTAETSCALDAVMNLKSWKRCTV